MRPGKSGPAAGRAVRIGFGGAPGALGLALLWGAVQACQPGERGSPEGEVAITREGEPGPRLLALRDTLRDRIAGDTVLQRLAASEGDVLIGIRTEFVRQIGAWLAGSYLDRVRLHLSPDLVVEHEDDVKVKIGPIGVHAGKWSVRVSFRSIRADLRVGGVRIVGADSNRMHATVSVASEGGAGDVTVDFTWDAAAVPSLVCEDFQVSEELSGTIPADQYRVHGVLRLEALPEGVVTVPDFSESPIRVSPRPTPESWSRIRAILEEAEEDCGPLDPDDIVEKLERVFRRGFEFELPESIFRPVRLPAHVRDRVRVADREVEVRARPVGLDVTEGTIWYRTELTASAVANPAPE